MYCSLSRGRVRPPARLRLQRLPQCRLIGSASISRPLATGSPRPSASSSSRSRPTFCRSLRPATWNTARIASPIRCSSELRGCARKCWSPMIRRPRRISVREAPGALLVLEDIAGREEEVGRGPEASRHQAQHREPQRIGVRDVVGGEPVAQGPDQRRRDHEITEIREEQHRRAEHRPHAARSQVVEQPEAGADVEVDRGNEYPQHRPGEREIAGVVDHPRGHRCDADAAGEEPHDPPCIDHAAAGHQETGHDGRDASSPQVHVLSDDARFADAHVVGALQEGRCPEHEPPAPQCADRRAHDHVHGGASVVTQNMHLWGGGIATVVTGFLMARGSMVDARRIVWLLAAGIGIATVASWVVYYTRDLTLARAMLWIFVPSIYFYIGPGFGLLNNLAPCRMRAMFCATVLFLANLGNLVIAPPLIGALSDWFAPNHVTNADSLRLAMLCLVPTGLWATAHLFLAARDILKDQERARGFPY